MKEKFLNIFLFLVSLVFIALGIILMFFNQFPFMNIIQDYVANVFQNTKFTDFFLAMFGSFIFSWGIFFFFLTVFTVMELKNTSIYGFIFWGFTFWALSFGAVVYLKGYLKLLLVVGVLYGILFLPYFLSLPFKSKNN